MAPYEKFKSLPQAEHFLKPENTFQQLDTQANAMSDTEAAQLCLNPFTTDRNQPPDFTLNPPRSDSYLDWNVLAFGMNLR